MDKEKLYEFLSVLAFALLIGVLAVLSSLYLEGAYRTAARVVIVMGSLILWQVLRKRYHRNR